MTSRFFFFNDAATTEIYSLSLHDAIPISGAGPRADDREHGRAVGEDGRLGVVSRRELLFRSLEHQPAQAEAERLVDCLERLAGRREPLGQVLPHPDFLSALPRAEPHGGCYHCTTMLAHVNPAPNAQNITFIPGWTRPHRTASSSAIATDAAEVLPKRSTFT